VLTKRYKNIVTNVQNSIQSLELDFSKKKNCNWNSTLCCL